MEGMPRMYKFQYMIEKWENFSQNFSHAANTVWGWTGGFLSQFFGRGTVGTTLILLWTLDLIIGTLLATRIKNWKTDLHGDMSSELKAEIKKGRKKPFSWSRFSLAIEKLAIWLFLAVMCVFIRDWIRHDNPMFFPVLSTGLGVIEFVLIFTEFRSVLHNGALYTNNKMLLNLDMRLGRAGNRMLDSIPGLQDTEDTKKLKKVAEKAELEYSEASNRDKKELEDRAAN
jgi:hypothetical protein